MPSISERQPRQEPPNGRPETVPPAWVGQGVQLWSAWRNSRRWQEHAEDEFGVHLGAHLLVLWALSTFSEDGVGEAVLGELIDDDLEPRFGGELVEDMVSLAFALGAGWAEANLAGGETERETARAHEVTPLRVIAGATLGVANRRLEQSNGERVRHYQ